MTSRERVRRAIRFQGPDRIPHLLPDGKENDILCLWPPGPPPKQDWKNDGDKDFMIDAWGNVRYRAAGGVLGFGEVSEPAIKDVRQQAECVFPDKNNPEHCTELRKTIEQNHRSDNPLYVLGVMPFAGLFAGLHGIMGLEPLLVAMYEEPDHVKALLQRMADAQKDSIRLLHDLGCDGVMAYDDWAVQDRLIMSAAQTEEFFMPHYRANWALAHELGMDVWMHSCGYIVELLPGFIDAGLNVIQMDQQENMGLELLNERFGGKLAFWCPVDIQRTMVEGSPEAVRAYVKRMIETLGGHNGGFVSKAYADPDAVHHKPENTAAMCAAFREFEALTIAD